MTRPILLALALTGSLLAMGDSTRVLQIVPGLTHREFACRVNENELQFEELRLTAGHGLELRALANPTAVRNPRCRNEYGGQDLTALLGGPYAPHDFKVLGAVNGTLFRVVNRRTEDGSVIHGYRSNSLLWSRGSGQIAPLRKQGGTRIFVVDSNGGRELKIRFETCHKVACLRLVAPFPKELASPASRAPFAHSLQSDPFLNAVRILYPLMTLAIQSNMPLAPDTEQKDGQKFDHYSKCPKDAQGQPQGGDWRCNPTWRTVLCGRTDQSISLLMTSHAFPFDLASGLRKGGPCQMNCVWMYNLDGGGSSQMGFQGKQGFSMSGSRMDTSEPGCSPYRPVDNYLLIGKAR